MFLSSLFLSFFDLVAARDFGFAVALKLKIHYIYSGDAQTKRTMPNSTWRQISGERSTIIFSGG
jgi:hypothetical protein